MCKCNTNHSSYGKQILRAKKYTDQGNPFAVFFTESGEPFSKSIESILSDDNVECMFLPTEDLKGERVTKKEYLKRNKPVKEIVEDWKEERTQIQQKQTKKKRVRKSKRTTDS